jgi:hypothetical protein
MKGGKEDVRSPGQPRFARFELGAKEKRTQEIVEEGAMREQVAFEALSTTRLDALLALGVDAQVRALLQSVRVEVARVEAAKKRLLELAARQKAVEADVTRVRENLAAAGKGGAHDAARKLGEKLIALEEELVKLAEEQVRRKGEIESARVAVAER